MTTFEMIIIGVVGAAVVLNCFLTFLNFRKYGGKTFFDIIAPVFWISILVVMSMEWYHNPELLNKRSTKFMILGLFFFAISSLFKVIADLSNRKK